MKMKLIATLIISINLAGNFLAGYAQSPLSGSGSADELLLSQADVESDMSAVFAVVNKNLSKQVDLIFGLIDFSSGLAGKALPKQKDNETQNSCASASILPVNSAGENRQTESGTAFEGGRVMVSGAPVAAILMVMIIYLSVRRLKFGKFFFLLPRGSIDDAIFNIKIRILNPLWLKAIGDFSFAEARYV